MACRNTKFLLQASLVKTTDMWLYMLRQVWLYVTAGPSCHLLCEILLSNSQGGRGCTASSVGRDTSTGGVVLWRQCCG